MKIQDLGVLHGTVLVYGGPYSNLAATRALIKEADARDVPTKNRICSGDVVAYGAEAEETWALVAREGGAVVAGNCERQLASGAAGCGCGFDQGSACDLLSKRWYEHAQKSLSKEALNWMAALPDIVIFEHAKRRVAVIHGGLENISRFVWPSSDASVFLGEVELLKAEVGNIDTVVAGHCGVAFQRQIGDVLWINAGAIGLPPHDGRPETRFAMLGSDGKVMVRRLAYDPATTVQAMTNAGLVQGYENTMLSGLWPSEDVLPTELKRAA